MKVSLLLKRTLWDKDVMTAGRELWHRHFLSSWNRTREHLKTKASKLLTAERKVAGGGGEPGCIMVGVLEFTNSGSILFRIPVR